MRTFGLVSFVMWTACSDSYVKDINEALSVGDEVKVKIKSVDQESGKISLSIRDTLPAPEKSESRPQSQAPRQSKSSGRPAQQSNNDTQGFNTLEDKLKDWLKQSNEIQADLNKRVRK